MLMQVKLVKTQSKNYYHMVDKIKIAVRAKRVTDILCRIYEINSVIIRNG